MSSNLILPTFVKRESMRNQKPKKFFSKSNKNSNKNSKKGYKKDSKKCSKTYTNSESFPKNTMCSKNIKIFL